jgi:hypothetical protein
LDVPWSALDKVVDSFVDFLVSEVALTILSEREGFRLNPLIESRRKELLNAYWPWLPLLGQEMGTLITEIVPFYETLEFTLLDRVCCLQYLVAILVAVLPLTQQSFNITLI